MGVVFGKVVLPQPMSGTVKRTAGKIRENIGRQSGASLSLVARIMCILPGFKSSSFPVMVIAAIARHAPTNDRLVRLFQSLVTGGTLSNLAPPIGH
jgi:hypothetical protein